MCLWSLGDADADQYWEIRRHTTDAIRATQTPDFDSSITSNTAPVDTWFHVAHVCRNDAGTYRHRVVLDGDWANSTEAPYTRPTGLDLLTIGALRFNANDFISLNGMVAHFAVWDGAVLSQAQVEALAVGADPRTIQSTNLIQYCRIAGSVSPEPDIVGTYDLTLVGSPTRADGPTVDGITISSNFEAVNEAVASDAEYVYAASAGLLDSYDVPTYDDPGTDEGFVVRYDVKQLTGGAGVEARMYQTGLPASVLLYVDWEHGVLASGTFTSDTPNVPDAHTFTFTNSATVGAEGTWDGQYVATFPNFNSVVSSVLSSATMAVTQGRVLVELEGMDSAGDGVGFYAASPANGRINIFLTGGGEVWVNLDWQGSNNKQIDLGAEPSGKYKVEIIYDTQNGTSSQRFRARCWAGDTPPSFTDSDNFGSADDTDQFTALRVPLNGDAHPTRLGRIIICNDITLDLSTITLAPETLISADPVQRFTAGTYEWAVDSADVANITDRSAVRVAVYSL